MKISRQIPYRILNQVSYLSWSVNLTAGMHSPHGRLKCTWKRENAGVKFSFPPFTMHCNGDGICAKGGAAVHGGTTNQSGLVWEKNSWHATSHVFTSVCLTLLYIQLWYTFVHSVVIQFHKFVCETLLYIDQLYSSACDIIIETRQPLVIQSHTTVCNMIMLWFVSDTMIQHPFVTQLHLSLPQS